MTGTIVNVNFKTVSIAKLKCFFIIISFKDSETKEYLMKKLLTIGLCIALNTSIQALHVDTTIKTVSVGQMCGDDDCNCDSKRPKPNDVV